MKFCSNFNCDGYIQGVSKVFFQSLFLCYRYLLFYIRNHGRLHHIHIFRFTLVQTKKAWQSERGTCFVKPITSKRRPSFQNTMSLREILSWTWLLLPIFSTLILAYTILRIERSLVFFRTFFIIGMVKWLNHLFFSEETREEKTYRNWMNSLGVSPRVNRFHL